MKGTPPPSLYQQRVYAAICNAGLTLTRAIDRISNIPFITPETNSCLDFLSVPVFYLQNRFFVNHKREDCEQKCAGKARPE
jgi:hypothetical protein